MNGKVLINVYSVGIKNDLLSILVQNGYDFLEVFNEHELGFKYNLVKDKLDLYVHELDENHYESSLEQLKKIDTAEVRCIVMIHKYSSRVIDDTLALNVKDIVVLPIERDNLAKKILSSFKKVTPATYMPASPPVNEGIVDRKRIDDEINRAVRGAYPLSFVMVEYDKMGVEIYKVFKRELSRLLRTTDMFLKISERRLLILCPFTPKSHLVEVENKIRFAHRELSKVTVTPVKIYLYGVTFPDDGGEVDVLLKTMKDGIHDSMVISSIEGPLHQIDRDAVKTRLRRDYK